jgi:outer membrane murein-binding lipoprotein Lpp
MSNEIRCKYCHHNWKSKIEYEKHIRCCEYFYQQRRLPSQPEMTETGVPIPNMRRLYQYVQDLTYRLEKTEKEVKKLRSELNARKKHEVLVWLNQPSQTPEKTFDEWTRNIKATESDMIKSLNGSLTDGVLSCLWSHLSGGESGILPIRCFSQKPGAFYVYSSAINGDASVSTEWRTMRPDQFAKLMNHIAKSIRGEFRVWNTAQLSGLNQEYDQTFMDKMPKYVKKLNADLERLAIDIKKVLFSKLEENLMVIVDC